MGRAASGGGGEELGDELLQRGAAFGGGDVADEHRATVVMYRLIGRLGPLFARRGTTRGAIVLDGAVLRGAHGFAAEIEENAALLRTTQTTGI